jgi:signal transduction histidine kinase
MIESYQKQPQIKILPVFSIDEKKRLKETDLSEITRMVEGLLPQYVNRDIDVTITLLEKNLKIMADMARMKEAVTQLLKNAMDALPDSGKFSLSINRVNFKIESILDGDDSMLGACAFTSLTDNGVVIDEKIKNKIYETFYITVNQDKGPRLPIAYRIIKQHQGSMKIEGRLGQGTEVYIYLPLTKPEIASMLSIPLSASSGRKSFLGGECLCPLWNKYLERIERRQNSTSDRPGRESDG